MLLLVVFFTLRICQYILSAFCKYYLKMIYGRTKSGVRKSTHYHFDIFLNVSHQIICYIYFHFDNGKNFPLSILLN